MPKQFRFEGKGLSVKQPWASAIAFAGKDIENRNWRTHYRGPLAIHASATLIPDDLRYETRGVRGGEKRPLVDWINRGRRAHGLEPEDEPGCSRIVAIAMVVDCIERSSSPWFDGEFGWVLAGVIPIVPILRQGARSTWPCRFRYTPLSK